MAVRRVPNVTGIPALVRGRTDHRTVRVESLGISRVLTGCVGALGDVWDFTSGNSSIKGINPFLGQLVYIGG